MRAAILFLLPSDGIFRRFSSSLQYYLTCQGRRVVLRGSDVALPSLERYLDWVYETAPTPSKDHGKENLPPQKNPQVPQEYETPQEKERASSTSRHIWKPAWNQLVNQARDECLSEASPDLPAPTASTASPLSS